MKLRSVLATLLMMGLGSVSATAGELKIGLIDLNVAMQNSKAYQQNMKRLEALQNKRLKELETLGSGISKAESELMGQSMAMSPDRLSQKQMEIKEQRKLYTRKQQDAQEEILGERDRLLQGLYNKASEVVAEYGKANHFDLIIAKPTVLYSSPAFDVTGEVTKLLDQKK